VETDVKAAAEAGVPDFEVNSRMFCWRVERLIRPLGVRVFLDAGACTVFVWGGPSGRGVSSAEIQKLVGALGGMANVKMNLREGYYGVKEIQELGVARISVGPKLWKTAMKALLNKQRICWLCR
jgi:2-methylisocitrate lyase-like PEP mutase family enzyme